MAVETGSVTAEARASRKIVRGNILFRHFEYTFHPLFPMTFEKEKLLVAIKRGLVRRICR